MNSGVMFYGDNALTYFHHGFPTVEAAMFFTTSFLEVIIILTDLKLH
jgi:hypothetical protein